MLNPSLTTKIYLAAGATDLRAGFEKLTVLAQALFAQPAVSGHYFLFCNAARTRLKILCWDGSGLWLLTKRLERGRFAWPELQITAPTFASMLPPAHSGSSVDSGPPDTGTLPMITLNAAELTLLLSGIDLTCTQRRGWWRHSQPVGPACQNHSAIIPGRRVGVVPKPVFSPAGPAKITIQ